MIFLIISIRADQGIFESLHVISGGNAISDFENAVQHTDEYGDLHQATISLSAFEGKDGCVKDFMFYRIFLPPFIDGFRMSIIPRKPISLKAYYKVGAHGGMNTIDALGLNYSNWDASETYVQKIHGEGYLDLAPPLTDTLPGNKGQWLYMAFVNYSPEPHQIVSIDIAYVYRLNSSAKYDEWKRTTTFDQYRDPLQDAEEIKVIRNNCDVGRSADLVSLKIDTKTDETGLGGSISCDLPSFDGETDFCSILDSLSSFSLDGIQIGPCKIGAEAFDCQIKKAQSLCDKKEDAIINDTLESVGRAGDDLAQVSKWDAYWTGEMIGMDCKKPSDSISAKRGELTDAIADAISKNRARAIDPNSRSMALIVQCIENLMAQGIYKEAAVEACSVENITSVATVSKWTTAEMLSKQIDNATLLHSPVIDMVGLSQVDETKLQQLFAKACGGLTSRDEIASCREIIVKDVFLKEDKLASTKGRIDQVQAPKLTLIKQATMQQYTVLQPTDKE
jgi:hypothetical protein